jgi:hypothetical protein
MLIEHRVGKAAAEFVITLANYEGSCNKGKFGRLETGK